MPESEKVTEALPSRIPWLHVILIALVIVLGLSVRAYHYNDESVCLEEYVGFKYLDAPDLLTYIHQTRDLYRTMAPVYYGVEYLWTRAFGPSVASVRALSVLAGTLVLPFIYLFAYWFFGKGTFGRRAGLCAMLMAALSPMHVFHSQEARQYAFFVLTGILSTFTLIRAIRGGTWRWWGLNVLANLTMMFTHPFGIFLPFAEGLYILLLMARRRTFRKAVFWIVAHLVLVGLWYMWIRDMPKDPSFVFGPYAPVITVQRVFNDIVGDDVSGMTTEFQATGQTWAFLPQSWGIPIRDALRPFRMAMLLALYSAMLWTAWRMLRLRQRDKNKAAEISEVIEPPIEDYAFLFLWLLVPPLTLTIMSFFTPCHMPRYTVYCALSLYVMLGGAVAAIPWRSIRTMAITLLIAIFGYHLSLAIPGLFNADWRSMAKLVETEGTPNDLVLVHGTDYLNILMFHMSADNHRPAASTSSREGLCDEADFTLNACAHSPSEQDHSRAVWAFIILDNGPPGDFESCMHARGLRYDKHEFPGLRHMFVYRITRAATVPQLTTQYVPFTNFARTIKLLTDRNDAELRRFRRQVSWDLDSWGGHYLRLAMAMVDQGAIDLAAIFFSKCLEFHPQYVTEFINLQRDVNEDGKYPYDTDAVAVLKTGVSIDKPEMKWWLPSGWAMLGEVLIQQRSYDEAIAALRKSIEYDSSHGSVYSFLAAALSGKGDYAEAQKVGLHWLEIDPIFGPKYRNFMTALYAKDYKGAWAELERLKFTGDIPTREFIEQLSKESGQPIPKDFPGM